MHLPTAKSWRLAAMVAGIISALAMAVPVHLSAQSAWTKMKLQFLQQACKGGDQKSCQALDRLNQKISGQRQQQTPNPRTQSQPGQTQSQPGQAQGQSVQDAPPAGTKVEEQLMAPIGPDTKFAISPHGMNVATVEGSGSRMVVYYDGVAGPRFDEILLSASNTTGANVIFSPDGKRYAYCGRIGEQWVVMVDGKELARSSESNAGTITGESCALGFTSNSQHVFYTTQFVSTDGIRAYWRFVFDGHSAPLAGYPGVNPVFSPDGNHYAMVVTDPADRNKYSLVIDGKVAPYLAGDLQWSGDSQHLYSVRVHTVPGATVAEALLDGKPFLRATGIKLYVPAKGNRVVAQVLTGRANQPSHTFLVIDGKEVPGSETENPSGQIDSVTLSPDGRHYAALYTNNNLKYYVFWDGKRGEEYDTVQGIGFTADSSEVVYDATANGKSFVIYGDQESDPCSPDANESPTGIVFAEVGNHAGAACSSGGTTSIFLDGKTLPAEGEQAQRLGFSPDGKHYAYVLEQTGSRQLVLDGVVQKESSVTEADLSANQEYLFSPDSQHVAHIANARGPGGSYGYGIFLDGRSIFLGPHGPLDPLYFTPDSRHLIWVQFVPQTSPALIQIFVDGKAVAEARAALAGMGMTVPWRDISPDGTLRVLVRDGNSLERLVITPSPNTSLQTLLAAGR